MIYLILVIISSLVIIFSIGSLLSIIKEKKPHWDSINSYLPVSILKPLCGADDDLETNLATFFNQNYPTFEVVFGVEGPSDESIPVVRKLMLTYPQVKCRLVIHNGGRGLNPKVSNLRAMLESGSHDIVVVSDSNVAVQPHYLRDMVNLLTRDGVGMVTNLIAGVNERTIGATLENLQLNSQVAGGVAASQVLGHTMVVGKSVMFRLSVFERLGGFSSLANLLAEDYVMGRMMTQAGYKVRLCSSVVRNVCAHTTLKGFMRRYLRWGMMRFLMKPLLYPLEPLSYPIAIALVAPLFGVESSWPFFWAVSLSLLRDGIFMWELRGQNNFAQALSLGMLKDIFLVLIWIAAPFVRHVSWRGHKVRISAGTRLYAHQPMNFPQQPHWEGSPTERQC